MLHINNGYGYDGTGNLLSIADTADGSYNRTLGFDGINRITAASGPWGLGSIIYDGAGNLSSQTLSANYLGYTYNSANRLISTVGSKSATYSYDSQGNISSDTGTPSAAGGLGVLGTSTYVYDGANNLRFVNKGSSDQVEYAYDGLNQRAWTMKPLTAKPLKPMKSTLATDSYSPSTRPYWAIKPPSTFT
jgi:hypothetical protein